MSFAFDPCAIAIAALQPPTRLVESVQSAVVEASFGDVFPLRRFAFARIAQSEGTTAELACHLRVTKQAAAQLVQRLVDAGYVVRMPHPADQRGRWFALTDRGVVCTGVARAATETAVRQWGVELGGDGAAFEVALRSLASGMTALRPPPGSGWMDLAGSQRAVGERFDGTKPTGFGLAAGCDAGNLVGNEAWRSGTVSSVSRRQLQHPRGRIRPTNLGMLVPFGYDRLKSSAGDRRAHVV